MQMKHITSNNPEVRWVKNHQWFWFIATRLGLHPILDQHKLAAEKVQVSNRFATLRFLLGGLQSGHFQLGMAHIHRTGYRTEEGEFE